MTTRITQAGGRRHDVELSIGGMTCASCAARIERKLNRMADALPVTRLDLEPRALFPTCPT